MSTLAYGADFFRWQQQGAFRSARTVVPLVLERFEVTSVVDVGCGVGAWLAAFREHGVTDVLGIDGDYIERGSLRIPAEQFLAADVRETLAVTRRFDLALCLEVAEHLPPDAGDGLIGRLTSLAPVVVFSAAIPGQGGTGHVNEQWQDYWRGRFSAEGYQAVDLIRPSIQGNPDVEFWYRQNIICYCDPGTLGRLPEGAAAPGSSLNWQLRTPGNALRDRGEAYLSKLMAMLPPLAVRAAKRRFLKRY